MVMLNFQKILKNFEKMSIIHKFAQQYTYYMYNKNKKIYFIKPLYEKFRK